MTKLLNNDPDLFPTSYDEIKQRIRSIDPLKYGKTRNFTDGAVTCLSPYVSRGVISTQQILTDLLDRGFEPKAIEKIIQELAWRDYWQQIWIAKGNAIDDDLKNSQIPIFNTKIPEAIVNATTGITAIDTAITNFYKTGYLHNHVRMYIASIVCNISKSHWKLPAKWMYYYLLDADWASNALSWQWVAGSNSHKKYYANQENINKYCYTQQKNTFLDVPYESLDTLPVPDVLKDVFVPKLKTHLPPRSAITVNSNLPTLIYNFYNLNPLWKKEINANRILLLEPSHFEKYPVSQQTIDFVLSLSKNIKEIQIFVGEFKELVELYFINDVYFIEHPLNNHYQGTEEPRNWMFSVKGYYSSFFSFWKKCKKKLTY